MAELYEERGIIREAFKSAGLTIVAATITVLLLFGPSLYDESNREYPRGHVPNLLHRVGHAMTPGLAGVAMAAAALGLYMLFWLPMSQRNAARREVARVANATRTSPQTGNSVNPTEWEGAANMGDVLCFGLEHKTRNVIAVAAFSDWRCQVTDPKGNVSEAITGISVSRGSVWVEYNPAYFSTARVPPYPGTYRYVWEAKTADGVWRELRRDLYQLAVGNPYPLFAERAREITKAESESPVMKMRCESGHDAGPSDLTNPYYSFFPHGTEESRKFALQARPFTVVFWPDTKRDSWKYGEPEQRVTEADLPAVIRSEGVALVTVKRFFDDGFSITEHVSGATVVWEAVLAS